MRYEVRAEGIGGIITHNGAEGLNARSAISREMAEINRKKGSNRTDVDDKRLRFLECRRSLYHDARGALTLPESALRGMIESAARKLKQGPLVREGLVVESVKEFVYDKALGTTLDEIAENCQFSTSVVIQRNRIIRTRARFEPWGCVFIVDCDDEMVDREQLESWLDIGGRRVGLGDWRPERSGSHGRFKVVSIKEL